jgi:signal transduction histidine kinase
MTKLFKDKIKNGKPEIFIDLELKHKNGSKIIVEVSTRFIKENNKIIGIVIICRDITKRKKAEMKLKEAHEKLEIFNQKLEEKVKERTAEVETLLHEKDEFIFHLSHDLRTPLTPLVAFLPLLEKKEKDPKTKENIRLLNNKVNTLNNLIDKTLKFETIYSSPELLDIVDINLRKEVEISIKNQRQIFKNKTINIKNKVKENISVKADRLYLLEVINNLLSNAIKNTPDSRRIIIDAEKIDTVIKISVKDNGLGMLKDHLDNIFKEFYKIDTSRHDLDSSGLGLSICKQIIEKHGGRIWAESKGLNKGSTFYFTLKSSI